VDVLEAVAAGRWPSDLSLRDHVRQCGVCEDLAAVATAFALADEAARPATDDLPSSDLVWWRAQHRARAESAAMAARPLTVAHGVGGAVALGLVAALVAQAPWHVLATWADTVVAAASMVRMPQPDALSWLTRGASLAIGVWLILTPVVVFLASED
jgi:hypothetical protein